MKKTIADHLISKASLRLIQIRGVYCLKQRQTEEGGGECRKGVRFKMWSQYPGDEYQDYR